MDQDALRELITDHANQPRNQRQLEYMTCDCVGKNPLCGDEVKLQIQINSQSKQIHDIAFIGRGCPISQASASIVTEICRGLTSNQAKLLADHLRDQITGKISKSLPSELKSVWTEIEPLTAINLNPARVKCVTLAWHTLRHALNNAGSTEIID